MNLCDTCKSFNNFHDVKRRHGYYKDGKWHNKKGNVYNTCSGFPFWTDKDKDKCWNYENSYMKKIKKES